MTRRILITGLLLCVALVVSASTDAPSAQPPPVTISQLRAKIADLRNDKADLRDEIEAQDAVISDQADTIQRLRARLANQPDPLEAILARGPDGQWAAIAALYAEFPALPEGALCGYDKSNTPGDGIGLTITSFTFYRWQGC